MGMEAEVVAVGQYQQSVADCLDYSAEQYSDVVAGTTVVTSLFLCVTSRQSRQLAEALHVKVGDFNTHCFNPHQQEPVWHELEGIDETDTVSFRKLIDAGFIFIYRPNS